MIGIKDYSHLQGIHMIKEGKCYYSYYREDFHPHQLFPVGCIFKSFLSVLVGIALQEGKIGSIEDCVIDYCDYNAINDVNWYRLKIKHVLSKTTGLIWPGPREVLPQNMNEVLRLSFEATPGELFKYKPDPQILVYLLEEVYRTDIVQILKSKLLCHFEVQELEWEKESIEEMRSSLEVLDELGRLMLNKGQIMDRHLFSESYLENSITPYSVGGFPECDPYGLGWWLGEYKNVDYYYAAGFGGQLLMIVPEYNLTISIASDRDRPHTENKQLLEQVLNEIM